MSWELAMRTAKATSFAVVLLCLGVLPGATLLLLIAMGPAVARHVDVAAIYKRWQELFEAGNFAVCRDDSDTSHNYVAKCSIYRRPCGEAAIKSSVIKRPIIIAGRRTGVSVEDAFWESLKEIAKQRDETLSHLIASIKAARQHANLSSAIRLYVLEFYRDQRQRRAMLDLSPSFTPPPA